MSEAFTKMTSAGDYTGLVRNALAEARHEALKIIGEYIQMYSEGRVKLGLKTISVTDAEKREIPLLQAVAADIEALPETK